jgi:hypothetical protein
VAELTHDPGNIGMTGRHFTSDRPADYVNWFTFGR